jgi:peptidoglycan/xylan/chitin deacetylase (PgdA/CDA1 family)
MDGRDRAGAAETRLGRRTALRAAAALGLAAASGCDRGGHPSSARAPDTAASSGTAGGPGTAGSLTPSGSSSPGRPGALPAEIVHGPTDRPNVALTFHGQGDPVGVGRLLDELAAGGARVTVLAVGTWLQDQPAMARRILDGGHELGNHTQRHLAIAAMGPAEAFAEINACAQTLKKLTGSVGAWFRPSQTQHSTPTIRDQASRAGYPTCLSYDVDSLDYTDPGAAAVVRTTLAAVQPGSIVSLHFGHAATIAAMPELLDGLAKRGLHPVSMTELMSR